jgi:hypothetical protein
MRLVGFTQSLNHFAGSDEKHLQFATGPRASFTAQMPGRGEEEATIRFRFQADSWRRRGATAAIFDFKLKKNPAFGGRIFQFAI